MHAENGSSTQDRSDWQRVFQDSDSEVAAEDQQHSTRSTRGKKRSSTQQGPQRPVLPLVLQHPSHEPAAMAVLAALYGVSEMHLLPQEQQLQAALLADMWQVPGAAATAVELLVAAVKEGGLSEAAAAAFMELDAIPDFMLPVFSAAVAAGVSDALPPDTLQRLLLRVLGDLEAVWADAGLTAVLLGLTLPAIEVLLGCDELQVASEDTVLFTAQSYVDTLAQAEQRRAAKQQLAPLIRCPHLSGFWLSALALSPDASRRLLSEQQAQVQKLSMLLHANPTFEFADDELTELLPGAPSSWALPERHHRPVSSVQLTWRVDIDKFKAKAQSVGPDVKNSYVMSPCATAPMGGLTFKMKLEAAWDAEEQGAEIGLFVQPQNVPKGAFYSSSFSIGVCGQLKKTCATPMLATNWSWGWPDYFGVGPMAGGWDEAAWAAQGLPTSGELVITATITNVSHSKPK